ncbi:hypothetical protein [Pseudomonas reactans]|uniref:hypothetical protein n=2 Tax=Pseudomonas TaxID=286 RepID=UPI0015A3060C|nr:hypothetical protein [Pseudomonas reactans]
MVLSNGIIVCITIYPFMNKRKATKSKVALPESTQPVAEMQNDDLDFSFLIEDDPIDAKNNQEKHINPNDDFTIDGLDYDFSENSVNGNNGLGITGLTLYSESVKEELVEIIAKIRKIKSDNDPYQYDVKSDLVLGYFASYHTKKCFYLPSFLIGLLKDYGFYAEVNELKIKAPEYYNSSGQIKFRRDMILKRKDGVFVFACCFRRSLRNFMNVTKSYGHIPWAFELFIEGLCNDNGCNESMFRCDEESIRTLGIAEMSLFSYEGQNDKAYEQCVIKFE